jgi:hypothetical protein
VGWWAIKLMLRIRLWTDTISWHAQEKADATCQDMSRQDLITHTGESWCYTSGWCGRTAWIILAQVRRPSLYRRHGLNALQTEQPIGLSGNVPMKPPDSGSIKRTSHEGESKDTITVTYK